MARPLRIQYENAYYHVTCRVTPARISFPRMPTAQHFSTT